MNIGELLRCETMRAGLRGQFFASMELTFTLLPLRIGAAKATVASKSAMPLADVTNTV
jgi:hypothetical protein